MFKILNIINCIILIIGYIISNYFIILNYFKIFIYKSYTKTIFKTDKNNKGFYCCSHSDRTGECGYVQNSGLITYCLKSTDCLYAVSLTSGSQGSEPFEILQNGQ